MLIINSSISSQLFYVSLKSFALRYTPCFIKKISSPGIRDLKVFLRVDVFALPRILGPIVFDFDVCHC